MKACRADVGDCHLASDRLKNNFGDAHIPYDA